MKWFVLFFLGATPAWSNTEKIFQLENRQVTMVEMNDHLLFSQNCFKGKSLRKSCQAFAVTKKTGKLGKLKFSGGENPGALICKKVGGEVVWAKDAGQNQNTLCQFKDETFISTGSLTSKLYHLFD